MMSSVCASVFRRGKIATDLHKNPHSIADIGLTIEEDGADMSPGTSPAMVNTGASSNHHVARLFSSTLPRSLPASWADVLKKVEAALDRSLTFTGGLSLRGVVIEAVKVVVELARSSAKAMQSISSSSALRNVGAGGTDSALVIDSLAFLATWEKAVVQTYDGFEARYVSRVRSIAAALLGGEYRSGQARVAGLDGELARLELIASDPGGRLAPEKYARLLALCACVDEADEGDTATSDAILRALLPSSSSTGELRLAIRKELPADGGKVTGSDGGNSTLGLEAMVLGARRDVVLATTAAYELMFYAIVSPMEALLSRVPE